METHLSRHSTRSIWPFPSSSISFIRVSASRPMSSISSIPVKFSRILRFRKPYLVERRRWECRLYSMSPLSMVPFPSTSSRANASSAALRKSSLPMVIFLPRIFWEKEWKNIPNKNNFYFRVLFQGFVVHFVGHNGHCSSLSESSKETGWFSLALPSFK